MTGLKTLGPRAFLTLRPFGSRNEEMEPAQSVRQRRSAAGGAHPRRGRGGRIDWSQRARAHVLAEASDKFESPLPNFFGGGAGTRNEVIPCVLGLGLGWGGKCRAWAAHLLDFAGLLEDGERAIGSHRLLHHHGLLHHHVGLHLRGPMDGGKEGRRDQANRLFSALLSRRVRVRLGRGANRAVIGARYRADGGTVRRRRGDCIQRAACQAVSGAGAGLSRRCLNLFFRH